MRGFELFESIFKSTYKELADGSPVSCHAAKEPRRARRLLGIKDSFQSSEGITRVGVAGKRIKVGL